MEFSYGQGEYIEKDQICQGTIILSEHKLFIKGPHGDLVQTYIPLEKIEKLKKSVKGIEVQVRPTMTLRYIALLKGERKHLNELIKDLVSQRGFKKRFLRNEWVEVSS